MNTPFLIDSIVRQVTVLIAQLGTAGGLRAPMAQLANQVFLHLAEELEAQGVSRKVSADMFGMALRAYVRKVTRLQEGHSAPGVTLWQAVLEFIREHGLVLRSRVLARFSRDPERVLLSVLHDLCESGLVFVLGSGSRVAYRAASDDELGELARSGQEEGLEELVWALVLHEGPLSEAQLGRRVTRTPAELVRAVDVDTCDSGLLWAGGDRRSAEMHPGSDCLACHDSASKRPLLVGGTVYPIGSYNGPLPLDDCFGLEGIEVIVTDADGRERSTVTNRAGNFYFEGRESDFPLPYQAEIHYDVDRKEWHTPMVTYGYYGGCARCHATNFEEYARQHEADGQLPYVPPEEIDLSSVVTPGGPIFPPGLYPN